MASSPDATAASATAGLPRRLSHSPSLSQPKYLSLLRSASLPPRRCVALHQLRSSGMARRKSVLRSAKGAGVGVRCSADEPLKVMISGAPASGKGTQCGLIVQKYGLVHISTGDLLRAEVSSGTDIGTRAREYMECGRLVPDEIVTAMVLSRISQQDAKERGWLLDGYPRTLSQAQSLEKTKIRPDIYIALDVPEEILINRCIGRRLDPVTGKIYHLKNFPPETQEISQRLITRPDDTEEKVKSRFEIFKQNAESIFSTYLNILIKVNGNRSKVVIFEEIDSLLQSILEDAVSVKNIEGKPITRNSTRSNATFSQDKWKGIPTRMNNIPHSKEIRKYFYDDVLQSTQRTLQDKKIRLKVEVNIPELNPEMDVYRIGTLLELVRTLALSFADDGKRVKVCVQGSMGVGALSGIPLQLAGSRKILEFMDWGDYGALGTFVNIGSIGAKDVAEEDDIFILVAPQNAIGNCIIEDLQAMTDAAGTRPVILVNPRLKDLPGSSGIMQTMGREKRMEYAASFQHCYFFRLLYFAGTQYPIMGAIRMSYPCPYELYKRVDESGNEKYVLIATFTERPSISEINDAFEGKQRNKEKSKSGVWAFLSSVLSS